MAERDYLSDKDIAELRRDRPDLLAMMPHHDGRPFVWRQTHAGESVALAHANCMDMQRAIELLREDVYRGETISYGNFDPALVAQQILDKDRKHNDRRRKTKPAGW